MKIILLHDVPKVGKKYEIKEVSPGFAENLLIPKGFSVPATPEAVKRLQERKKREEDEKAVREELLKNSLKSLDGGTIELKTRVSDKGHLFSSVHKEDIAKTLFEQKHLEIPAESIVLDRNIKEVGEHKITVRVGESQVSLTLKVTASR